MWLSRPHLVSLCRGRVFRSGPQKNIANLLRFLASRQEGEVLGSVRALGRRLKAAGADFHTLADLVEQADGSKLSEAEMQKLYGAGYEAGHADGVRGRGEGTP